MRVIFCRASHPFARMAVLLAQAVFLTFLAGFPPAQAAVPPDAGGTLSGLQERQLPPEQSGTTIKIEPGANGALPAEGPKVLLKAIRITGQDIFPEDKLLDLVRDACGKEQSLADLQTLADRLTGFFRDQGYLVANAYLPAQEVKDGTIEIAVLVGRYGEIDLQNTSRLVNGTVSGMLKGLKPGDYIKRDKLERALLLLNDTGGVTAGATLAPGKETGAADLIVAVRDAKPLTGQLFADTWGNRFTGRTRFGLVAAVNNPGGNGDTFTFGGITTGGDLTSINLSYAVPLGSDGGRLTLSHNNMHYILGEDFASLNATGRARITGLAYAYPLRRAYDASLYGRIGYDDKYLRDEQTGYLNEKRARVWYAGLSGNWRDTRAFTAFDLAVGLGSLHIDTPEVRATDASTAGTAGSYRKMTLSLLHRHYLDPRTTFTVTLTGQTANKNLDSAEKLSLGGANAVRAYPQGEALGDAGYVANLELRRRLPVKGLPGEFSIAGFYDFGSVSINKNPWPGAGDNARTLAGYGFGLMWNRADDFGFRLDYAWKATSDPAVSDTDKNGRLWLQGVKYF